MNSEPTEPTNEQIEPPLTELQRLGQEFDAGEPTNEQIDADSGMSGKEVERAELLWANLPTGRKWTSLATHEKALVCHIIAAAEHRAHIAGMREAEGIAESMGNEWGPKQGKFGAVRKDEAHGIAQTIRQRIATIETGEGK